MNQSSSQKGPKVPRGCFSINSRWEDTPLGIECQKRQYGYIFEGLGIVDFYISSTTPVILISEDELMANSADYFEPKFAELKADYSKDAGIIITIRNTLTIEKYSKLVDIATFKFNLSVIPIGTMTELPKFLKEMTEEMCNPTTNPFLTSS